MQRVTQEDTGVERRRRERLVALVLFGVLLFNYPLLKLFGVGATPLGLPLLFLYIFLVWGVFIWLVARVLAPPAPGPAGSAEVDPEVDGED